MTAQLDDDKLKTVKTEVHCTLISTKDGLTVKDFLRDYREAVGRPFPHVALGYKTTLDFMKSIPDVVNVVNQIGGPELLLPVQTEKSAHINKFILEQKSTKKTFRRPRPIQLPTDNRTPSSSPSRTLLPVPKEPPVSLRRWEKNRNYPVQKNDEYHWIRHQSMTMTAIPVYNNYNPQVMEMHPFNSFFTSHFQSKPFHTPFPFNGNADQSIPSSAQVYQGQNLFQSSLLPLQPNHEQCDSKDQNVIENGGTSEQKSLVDYEESNKDDKISRGQDEKKKHSPEEVLDEENTIKDSTIHDNDSDSSCSSCNISDKMKINFRRIVSEHPGIKTSQLPSAYEEMFGVPLNHSDLGFPTVKELVMACSDVFKIRRSKGGKDWLLFDSSSSLISSDGSLQWIPKQVLENMEQLSRMFPNGLMSKFILSAYMDMFKVPLDFKKLGFETLTSFLVNCQSIDCKIKDENCTVFPVDWGQKQEVPSELEDWIPEPFLSLENVNFLWKKYFNDDVCNPTFKFEKFILPNSDTLKVLVSDALSPDVIWLQNATTGYLLNELMFELNNFYDEAEASYKLNDNMLIPGLVCCAKFNPVNSWHRVIIYPPNGNEVKVLYVDYGTTAVVQIEDLRLLHRKFADLPIQAIKAKLHNVKPIDENGWSEEALEYLFKMCLNHIFVAEIVTLKAEIPFIEVILCDTSGPDDVFINEALIANSYAVPNIQNPCTTSDSSSVNPSLKETSCPIMSYPECFLNLLPSWLSVSEDWTAVFQLLEKAKSSYIKDASFCKTYDENSGMPPPSCCLHHLLTHVFVNKPKLFCNVWKKTFEPFRKNIEQLLVKNLSSEMAFPLNLKTSKHFCYLQQDEIEKLEETRNDETEKNNLHSDIHIKHDPSTDREDLEELCNHLNSSLSDESDTKSSRDREVKRYMVEADIGEKTMHFIRRNNQVYVLMQELLMAFARSVPTLLVKHRLLGSRINMESVQITPDDPFHQILYENNIVKENETASMIPLSIAGDVLLNIDPMQTAVSETFKETAETFDANHPYWFE